MMSRKLMVLACVALILTIISAPTIAAETIVSAIQSCRTDIQEPDTNKHDSSKLSVRSDNKSCKSWIKFELDGIDVTCLEAATLTVTLHQEKSDDRNFDVSYVNDDCTDNIDWDEKTLTWNNAPANNTEDYSELIASKATLLGTLEFTDGEPGDAFTIDVMDALEEDTDGIVQFVLHNSNGYMVFATHDHSEESYRPYLTITEGSKATAKKPDPAVDAEDVYLSPVLSWESGSYVDGLSPQHKLFFSLDFNDVNDGVDGITLDVNEYSCGTLEYNQTYYWRVDEANSSTGWDEGKVWSFTTEPVGYAISGDDITATASSVESDEIDPDNTINGEGLDEDDLHSDDSADMWISDTSEPNEAWIAYAFDKPYKLAQMLVWNSNTSSESYAGLGIKDALIEYSTDGNEWVTWGTTQFSKATDQLITEVDIEGIVVQEIKITALTNWGDGLLPYYSLSEVRFLAVPTQAREMSPDEDATGVDPDVTLSWRAGRGADTHEIYLGTDESDLPLIGTTTGVPYASYDISDLGLELGQTYYWRIDEVNGAEVWEGDTLAFTTAEYIVVDDFESYGNNADTYSRVFQTWIDGAGYSNPVEVEGNGTGSYIGYDPSAGDIMEKTIVYSGSQSAPIDYGNGGEDISEVTRTFDESQDWTRSGVQTLSIAFYGEADNTGDLYININNKQVDYDGDDTDIAAGEWIVWEIALSSVSTDLEDVESMTIGIEDGEGMLYVDDIILYP